MAGFFGLDVDGAILAVAFEEGGFVGDEIAAANDLLQGGETGVEAADGAWGEGGSAGEFGDGLQSAFADLGIVVEFVEEFARADGVDGDLSALGAADGLLERVAAGVVLAIADDDEHSGYGLGFGAGGEFIGGEGDSIPKGGAAGGHELADGMGDEFLVAGEILHEKN